MVRNEYKTENEAKIKKRILKWLVVLFFVLFASIAVYAFIIYSVNGWAAWRGSPKDIMRGIVEKHQVLLTEAVLLSEGKLYEKNDSALAVFKIRDITQIDGRCSDVSVVFSFPWTYSTIPEGTITLQYLPADTFTPGFPETAYPSMALTNHSENSWRWEGCGIGGSGYYVMERFAPNWFYVETYVPT